MKLEEVFPAFREGHDIGTEDGHIIFTLKDLDDGTELSQLLRTDWVILPKKGEPATQTPLKVLADLEAVKNYSQPWRITRAVKSIAATQEHVIVLANDGTLWRCNAGSLGKTWLRLPDLPQGDEG